MFDALTPLSAAIIAQAIEKKGYKFYEKAVEAFKVPVIQNLFITLRDQEKKHYELFSELYNDLIEKGERELSEDEKNLIVQKANIDAFFLNMGDITGVKEPEDVLKNGIVAEQKSIEFYNGIKDKYGSKKAKEIFDTIILEEQQHEQNLTDMLKLVEERGLYY